MWASIKAGQLLGLASIRYSITIKINKIGIYK